MTLILYGLDIIALRGYRAWKFWGIHCPFCLFSNSHSSRNISAANNDHLPPPNSKRLGSWFHRFSLCYNFLIIHLISSPVASAWARGCSIEPERIVLSIQFKDALSVLSILRWVRNIGRAESINKEHRLNRENRLGLRLSSDKEWQNLDPKV